MGEAGWHPELLMVGSAQADPNPVPEGGRTAAQIHRHVKDFPHHAAHQLALGLGRQLVMQAAQHALGRARMVVLHKSPRPGKRLKGALVPALEEKAAPIAKQPGREQQGPLQGHAAIANQLVSLHGVLPGWPAAGCGRCCSPPAT